MPVQLWGPVVVRNWVVAVAGLLAFLALYVLAIDQGLMLSLAQGDIAFSQNLLHEIVHDARHAAGFPCH